MDRFSEHRGRVPDFRDRHEDQEYDFDELEKFRVTREDRESAALEDQQQAQLGEC